MASPLPPSASSSATAPSATAPQASRPIVYGSCAFWRGTTAEESKSHEWTVYIRAANPEEARSPARSTFHIHRSLFEVAHADPGLYIKRVVFQLHPSFNPATRVIEKAPFEVTEQGWGEFEVQVKVFFHASGDRAVEFSHLLKLYPDPETTGTTAGEPLVEGRPVVSERYDEVVFGDAGDDLRARLAAADRPSSEYGGWKTSPLAQWFGNFEAIKPQEALLKEVYERITTELRTASKRRLECEEEIKRMRAEAA